MNKKVLMIGLVAGTMVLGSAGTANAAFNFTRTKTESKTDIKTVEDSMGETYEVKHTIKKENGNTEEYFENVPCEIYNETGEDIAGFYMVPSESDNWGANILNCVSEGYVMGEDGHVYGLTMSYHPETLFDVKAVFTDGRKVEFNQCGMDELDDAFHINVEIVGNGDGNYKLYLV